MSNALRIDGEQDVLQLSARSSPYPVTMKGWFKQRATRSGYYSAIFTVEYGAGHSTDYNELGIMEDGVSLIACDTTNYPLGSVAATISNDVWYKVAFVIGASRIKIYFGVEGTPGLSLVLNEAATHVPGVDYQGLGASNYASAEWFNGCLAQVSVWEAELTLDELELEFTSESPVRTLNLLGAWLPPTVTVPTVLTAVSGADLIDGAGGGTPDYTIEAGPTVDPAPDVFTGFDLSLRSSGAGTFDLSLSNSYTEGSAAIFCLV